MMAACFIPSILLQGIYTGIISTISTVTMGTCKLISSIYTCQHSDINKIMKELDISRRLLIIQAVLSTINQNSIHKNIQIKLNDLEKTQVFNLIGSKSDLKNDPIELCLIYLQETIYDIHNDLFSIKNRIDYHNTKWFSSWRTLYVTDLIDNLKSNTALLNSRFDDLTKISVFLHNRLKKG